MDGRACPHLAASAEKKKITRGPLEESISRRYHQADAVLAGGSKKATSRGTEDRLIEWLKEWIRLAVSLKKKKTEGKRISRATRGAQIRNYAGGERAEDIQYGRKGGRLPMGCRELRKLPISAEEGRVARRRPIAVKEASFGDCANWALWAFPVWMFHRTGGGKPRALAKTSRQAWPESSRLCASEDPAQTD